MKFKGRNPAFFDNYKGIKVKVKINTINGWQIRSVSFLVFSLVLFASNFAFADGVRQNIPTKLAPPPAELTPLLRVGTPPLVIVPVLVGTPKEKCHWVRKESLSYEQGTSFFVPPMLISAPACGCCGAQATWLNGASFSSSPQTSTSVTLQLICQ